MSVVAKSLFRSGWYLTPMAHTWWIGFVAVIAGWMVTESGRQPWVIYGVMRTADGFRRYAGDSVATTLALFVVVYGIIFSMGIYYINRLIAKGPPAAASVPDRGTPKRPLSSVEDVGRQALNQP